MGSFDQGRWNFFQCQVREKPASVFLDLEAGESRLNLPELVIIFVPLLAPSPKHGMSTDSEFEKLTKIEDALSDYVCSTLRARYVGRITTNGSRNFYFYAPRRLEISPAPMIQAFPEYEMKLQWYNDPDWTHYHNFYPRGDDLQRMTNRDVLAALKKNGDDLTKARPVRHWSYFPDETARDAFLDQIKAAGYQIISAGTTDPKNPDDPKRFSAIFDRTDHVDENSIDKVTVELFRLAARYGGSYDGWETQVVK